MPSPAALAWSWTNALNRKRYEALLERFGTLEDALIAIDEEMLLALKCRESTAREILLRLAEFDADQYAARLAKAGVTFLTLADPAYPPRLKQTSDAPPFLYVRGDAAVLDRPGVGMVGTRGMSPYGRRVAQECTEVAVQGGLVTVSGLAEGIDGEVARETLRLGGTTVAVLGHGLSDIFPRGHRKLAEEVVAGGGALVSEYSYDMQSGPHTFPARNRIIAGLSLATLVLEAPEGSGALITAEFALEEGRDVLAVPGQMFDANYAGCHRLIASGQASLLARPGDLLTALGVVAPERREQTSRYVPQSPEEERVLQALSSLPQPVDALVEKTGLTASAVGGTLTLLELSGAARNTGGGQWIATV